MSDAGCQMLVRLPCILDLLSAVVSTTVQPLRICQHELVAISRHLSALTSILALTRVLLFTNIQHLTSNICFIA
jgi:hypothetical protein